MTSKTLELDEHQATTEQSPGDILRRAREKFGISIEAVASRLHLRVKIIEDIETDNYAQMPESVFIKGYLRAYANLLALDPSDILEIYNEYHHFEPKPNDRVDWQNKQLSHTSKENWFKWMTLLIALTVVTSIALWWNKQSNSNHTNITANQQSHQSLVKQTHKLLTIDKLHTVVQHPEVKGA